MDVRELTIAIHTGVWRQFGELVDGRGDDAGGGRGAGLLDHGALRVERVSSSYLALVNSNCGAGVGRHREYPAVKAGGRSLLGRYARFAYFPNNRAAVAVITRVMDRLLCCRDFPSIAASQLRSHVTTIIIITALLAVTSASSETTPRKLTNTLPGVNGDCRQSAHDPVQCSAFSVECWDLTLSLAS